MGSEHTSATVEVRLLGDFQVRIDDATVTLTGHPARLLKHLAVSEAPLHVEVVTDRLWPDASADVGRTRLRNVLARLRDRVPGAVVRDGEVLRLGATVEVDARELKAAVRTAGRTVRDDPLAARTILEKIPLADLGELLPGDPYDPVFASYRNGLSRTRLTGLDLLAHACEKLDDVDAAVAALQDAVDVDPDDEDRYVRLIDLLFRHHRPAAARVVLRRADAMLSRAGLGASAALESRRDRLRATP